MGTRATGRERPRLDQVLRELGYADETAIARALARQRAVGGRLGWNLRQLDLLTETQLTEALGRQFGVPWELVSAEELAPELLSRIPPPSGRGDEVAVPLGWDEESSTLTLGVGTPLAQGAIARARGAFHARRVIVKIVPDSTLARAAELLAGWTMSSRPGEGPLAIELPEVFSLDDREEDRTEGQPGDAAAQGAAEGARVLMLTDGAARKNFLPPVFEREGRPLTVVRTAEEMSEALGSATYDAVLVSSAKAAELRRWLREGRVPRPRGGVQLFGSVSGALLDNPVPYEAVVSSVRAAAEALGGFLQGEAETEVGESLPALRRRIAAEVGSLARAQRLPALAADGLHVASHLLAIPDAEAIESWMAAVHEGAGRGPLPLPFREPDRSREIAAGLGFPWPLEKAIAVCHALFAERGIRGDEEARRRDVVLGGRLLALVWLRNVVLAPRHSSSETLTKALREVGGHLAEPHLVEAYIRLHEGGGGALAPARQVVLVGRERVAAALSGRLTRAGLRTVHTADPADGREMLERAPPAGVVIDHETFSGEAAAELLRAAAADPSLLAFVLLGTARQGLALDLLDAGADDVFLPPHDFELLAARIARAVESRARIESRGWGEGAGAEAGAGERRDDALLSATFEAFPFLDLAQSLSHGLRSVRVELEGEEGETAVLHLERGHPVHAECGELEGEAAVYRVIEWEDRGRFRVFAASSFPEANMELAMDAVLMEGCRRLDESGAS